ncbi:Essential recombination function protein [uncultured Caudovirales phage]|uniref:Essential recombination function protein n=1 Tax=uncultured Caudovirales phage TaxID=2100421 RepID=A0A6J5PZS3_9CAUD|nr:Essential recombination function protein [uncultured Caudovirales phage]CAB4199897.1 Essential recombination function protein [uncultured Caudovirales phage]CAB4218323.1 Essential recombination function protein [uncultured Caudovirales phage]
MTGKIHSKLSEILKAVGYIEKTGTNASQGYKYVQAAAVADKIRDEFAKRSLTMIPATIEVTESGLTPSGKQALVTLRVTWQITDGESGEFVTFQSVGSGSDSTDKAVYKAMTGALKYALLLGFLIPTGDDPENEKPSSDAIVASAAKKIFDEEPATKKAQAFDANAIEF